MTAWERSALRSSSLKFVLVVPEPSEYRRSQKDRMSLFPFPSAMAVILAGAFAPLNPVGVAAPAQSPVSLDQAVDLHAAGQRAEAYALFTEALEEARHAFRHAAYADAEELFRDWIEHFERLSGEDPSSLIVPRSYVARCVAELDGPAEALPLADELYATIDFDHHDHSDLRALISLNTGVVLTQSHDLARAEVCLEDATHTVQEMPHSPLELHLDVLAALRDLRVLEGRIQEARDITIIRRNELETRRGEDPQLEEALGLLESAHLLRTKSPPDYHESAGRMAACVELLEPYLGTEDPFLLRVRVEQAQALLFLEGTGNTAKHLLEDAIERYQNQPVLNRDAIASAKSVLAFAMANRGEPERALELMEESLALYEADGVRGSPEYDSARQTLCQLARNMGRSHPLCP